MGDAVAPNESMMSSMRNGGLRFSVQHWNVQFRRVWAPYRPLILFGGLLLGFMAVAEINAALMPDTDSFRRSPSSLRPIDSPKSTRNGNGTVVEAHPVAGETTDTGAQDATPASEMGSLFLPMLLMLFSATCICTCMRYILLRRTRGAGTGQGGSQNVRNLFRRTLFNGGLNSNGTFTRDDVRAILERMTGGIPINIDSDGGHGGASETDIARLPLQTFKRRDGASTDTTCEGDKAESGTRSEGDVSVGEGGHDGGGDSSRTCAICLSDFDVGDTLRTMPCLHMLHKECVDRWLRQNASCPVCKHSVLDT